MSREQKAQNSKPVAHSLKTKNTIKWKKNIDHLLDYV